MIPFEHALQIVLDAATPSAIPCEMVSLEKACGRILQQTVFADRDMPPFNKSAVDGYACRYEDLETERPLRLLESISAGSTPKYTVTQGCCCKVMTGAMVPQGAECVVMVEDTLEENGLIHYRGKKQPKPGICLKGEDITSGTPLLTSGTLIQPTHLGLLSAVGNTTIQVAKKIKVGIISTGDELTEPWERPRTEQIRNSNSRLLMAQTKSAGALASYYGIARDHVDSLAPLLSAAMEDNELVIVSGGVSMGDYDIVPEVAKDLGFDILFDSVAVQPGKPTTFGVGSGVFFFGLPGNPVSTFIQFELMVRPFINRLMGAHYTPLMFKLPLAHAYTRKNAERMAHLPATINASGSCSLIDYHGSAHLSAFDRAKCLMRIQVGATSISAGELVEIVLL